MRALAVLLALAGLAVVATCIAGGWSEPASANQDLQKIANAVRKDVRQQLNKKLHAYRVVSYRQQVVAGTNYLFKIHICSKYFIHIKVYKDLQGKITLSGVSTGHTATDALEPFN